VHETALAETAAHSADARHDAGARGAMTLSIAVIDRYVSRSVIVRTLTGFGLLVGLISAYYTSLLLRDAAMARIPSEHVLVLLGLRDIIASEVILPTALFGAVLVTLTYLHRDREAYAMYAAGVAPERIARTMWVLAILFSVGVAVLSTFARPWAYRTGYELQQQGSMLNASRMRPGKFYPWGDNLVLSAAEIESGSERLGKVFVQRRTPGITHVIRAEHGRILAADEERQRIELASGYGYWLADDSTGLDREAAFDRLVYFAQAPDEPTKALGRRARSTLELSTSTVPRDIAEFQWRFSMPLIALFVTMLATRLGRVLPGRSPYPRFALGIILYAVVFNLGTLARTWVESGTVATFPGLYWVPAVIAGAYWAVGRIPRLSLSRPR
jgi:lipopolysaccharide export system permease protein